MKVQKIYMQTYPLPLVFFFPELPASLTWSYQQAHTHIKHTQTLTHTIPSAGNAWWQVAEKGEAICE